MYRHHTRCYQHVAGDKPYNINDLPGFILGTTAPGIIAMLAALAAGMLPLALAILAVQYALTIGAAADEWLYHRLICVNTAGDPHCAIGTIIDPPQIGDLGAFDNDEFFDIRLMPHAPFKANLADADKEALAQTMYDDNFQGERLLKPSPGIDADLPYAHKHNYFLHCEAEGDFWVAMKDYALLLGALVAAGAGAGAAAGAAAGCAIGVSFFGPIGCAIGAFLGGLFGGAAGAAGGAYLGALFAFNTDEGDVDDANLGDKPLGELKIGDKVIVIGHLVYDGFHEGWHEFHPLMGVMRVPNEAGYIEHDPAFPDDPDKSKPWNLTPDDMHKGMASPDFQQVARNLQSRACTLITDAFDQATRERQRREEHRWTIHPAVDGCRPPEREPAETGQPSIN